MSRRLPQPSRPANRESAPSLPETPVRRRPLENVYLLLDAARSPKIYEYVTALSSGCTCLYAGESKDRLADVAPYLIQVDPMGDVFQWFVSEGWGDSWGLIVTSAAPLEDLYKHFRKFLIVEDEEGKRLYFRFYDPRVIGVFLKTCTPEETQEFFGPISRFIFERSNAQGQTICRGPVGAYAEKTDVLKSDLSDYLMRLVGATS